MNNTDVFRFWTMKVMRIFAMLATRLAWLVGLLWFGALMSRADTHYVATSALSVSPYTSWGDAASNIEWAVNVATNGETVLVSNGTYNLTNQVNIFSNITVRSFAEQGHGTNDTIVNGNNYEGKLVTNRCFYMTNGVLDGFTISNGYAGPADSGRGGGVYIKNAGSVFGCFIYRNYCSNDAAIFGGGGIHLDVPTVTAGIVSNCTIVSNIVYESIPAKAWYSYGGGIYSSYGTIVASYISWNKAYSGGGVYLASGLITNCTVANNLSTNKAGVFLASAMVRNCLIITNVTMSDGAVNGDCGGVYVGIGSTIYDSIIMSNRANRYNGGLVLSEGGIASNCQIIGNSSGWNAGGVAIDGTASLLSLLVNCVVRENISGNGNGAGVQQANATTRNCLIISNKIGYGLSGQESLTPGSSVFENCTVVGNDKGLWLQTGTSTVRNCIIYSNAASEIVIASVSGSNNCRNICTSPSGIASLPLNQGNFTNNPMFVDWVNGNYRLLANSPCINVGANQSWMTNGVDLDGRTRIRYGTVDLGPYELIHSATIYGFR